MSVVSAISAIKRYKAVILKVRYKILFNSVRKQVESITPTSLLVISSIYVFYSKYLLRKKGGGGNCGHRRATWHGSEVSTVASKFFFSFLFDAYRRAVWHEGEV